MVHLDRVHLTDHGRFDGWDPRQPALRARRRRSLSVSTDVGRPGPRAVPLPSTSLSPCRSRGCSSRTAARSRCGSSAPAASSGSRPSPSRAEDDAGSLHARSADETVAIASYLDAGEHVRAAQETGADAIHPGYGFLAENADFAEAVEAAGLTWVGPPPAALRAGGDKLEAKRIAREAGVPVVPEGEPAEIGFPLVVKAAAGGGGRGMRVVREPAELDEALAAAKREAKAAFGDERVFCERYVERPRHVEIQLLGDSHGTIVALGERECSVQRRHQKVLEEAPSPALDPRAARADERRRGRVRAGDRLPQRRHRRVHARRPRLLVPGAERPHPGRAPGDRARHAAPTSSPSSSGSRRASRSRPSRGWSGTRSRCGSTRRTRERSCRRPGRLERLRLPERDPRRRRRRGGRRGRHRLRPADREADRARLDARGRARPPRGRARRDRGRRRRHEPALPALAGRAPGPARRARRRPRS